MGRCVKRQESRTYRRSTYGKGKPVRGDADLDYGKGGGNKLRGLSQVIGSVKRGAIQGCHVEDETLLKDLTEKRVLEVQGARREQSRWADAEGEGTG